MTTGDERRVMPPSAPLRAENQPPEAGVSNPFKPLSAENRITGAAGAHRPAQSAPVPGNSYGYGAPSAGLSPTGPLFPDISSREHLKNAPAALPKRNTPSPVPYQSGERYGAPSQPTAPERYNAPSQPSASERYGVPSQPSASERYGVPLQPSASNRYNIPLQPLAPERYGVPSQPSASERYGVPSQPSASERYGVPSQPSASERYGVPSQPSASERYGMPSQPSASERYPAAPSVVPKNAAYTPRHGVSGLQPARGLQPPPVSPPQPLDPWVTLGWKAPAAQRGDAVLPPEYTAQPPQEARPNASFAASNPYSSAPPPAMDVSSPMEAPYDAPVNSQPYFTPMFTLSGAYPPATALEDFSANGSFRDTTGSMQPLPLSGADESEDGGTLPEETPSEPTQKPTPKPRGLGNTVRKTWRMALIIACSLAVLLCVVEVAKMVQSLMVNEQTLQTNRAQLAELAGVDPDATAAGLELLPAGQTYAPTASPLPAHTPTPEPRVAQNDPLIGVLDQGGVTTAADQTAQPTAAQATRTRLTSYPDNPLLSVSDDFTALRQQNGDVVGRLVIDGVLDETLVQRNNTYYLTHNARGTLGNGGAVFVDESILLKKPPENLLIRGQASQPGKLLAPLAQFGTAGQDFLRKHGLITCQTIYEKAEYVVFAVVHADSDPNSSGYFNYAGYPTFQTDAQMMDYVKAAQTASLYPIGVSVKASDRLLTIATLPENGDTKSWVVLCRMLRNGEDASHIQTE